MARSDAAIGGVPVLARGRASGGAVEASLSEHGNSAAGVWLKLPKSSGIPSLETMKRDDRDRCALPAAFAGRRIRCRLWEPARTCHCAAGLLCKSRSRPAVRVFGAGDVTGPAMPPRTGAGGRPRGRESAQSARSGPAYVQSVGMPRAANSSGFSAACWRKRRNISIRRAA